VLNKDAADVLRLMSATSPAAVGATLAQLVSHPTAGEATAAALRYLGALFGRRGRPGIGMAAEAMRLAVPAARVEAICVAYTTAMLETVAEQS
jgi:anaerobic selenocysteine-containing dehydrogenase